MSRISNRSFAPYFCIAVVIAVFTLVSCAGTQTKTTSSNHPEVDNNPMCSECHDDKQIMDHDSMWGTKHEFTLNPQKGDCVYCHGNISSCGSGCHAS
jgi:hypothetical protein